MIHDRITESVRKQLHALSDETDGYSYHLHTSRGVSTSTTCPSCHVEAAGKEMVAYGRPVFVVVCMRCETVSITVKGDR